jgi:hypothetical protein
MSAEFLTAEESSQVDGAMLPQHEKFLTRITISSMRLLKHIAQESKITVEELTVDQIITWFEQDAKIKREQGIEAGFLKW